VFGWTREQVVGRPLTDTIVPPESAEEHRRGLCRVVGGGPSHLLGKRVEATARHRDGHEIPVELAVWQDRSQHVKHFHALIHDITERLHLEAERARTDALARREEYERRLHQAQRLESLGQLAGGVAHDFNNLLAVIVNYLSLVAEEVNAAVKQDPDRWRTTCEDIAQVQQATDRATRLARQLLTLGRRDIAKPEMINLNELVAEMEELLHRTLGEQVELVTRTTADLWPTAADRSQLGQILVNLAVNARDAMPDGGTLSISTGNVVADEQYTASHPGHPVGRFVRVQVSDTGTGMSAEVADRAFEPFFTTKPNGAGLGLGTVYGILTRAGGHATICSEPGCGTTVNVLLPVTEWASSQRPPKPKAPAEPMLPGAGGRTVLLVEDEGALREVTRRILTRNGFRVIAAGDGAEAIQRAEQEDEIHLLLTDVVMPKMFGKAVASEIRARRPGIRVLFMSGYAQPVLASEGTLEPGVTLLEKPFSEETLLDRVHAVLDSD
jgi:PAS domain S-box-containing protein